ncbi:unnamed protein product [Adineta ricciae]|uniref:VCBS repeat-containing protein n=1 Tax=Adineta ricciae TaxID=249248 RepID=A0A814T5R7_ADIRI|nr:unnamed protein product [Adineta ricciae]CAF1165372.1 unnamed protein product [Adineta ricciae]
MLSVATTISTVLLVNTTSSPASSLSSTFIVNCISMFYNETAYSVGTNPVSVTVTDNGTFKSENTYAVGANPYLVVTNDLNNDSKIDLIVVNHGSDSVGVLLNKGN